VKLSIVALNIIEALEALSAALFTPIYLLMSPMRIREKIWSILVQTSSVTFSI